MRKRLLWAASAAFIVFQISNANADTFDWSYTGVGISGSGTLTATQDLILDPTGATYDLNTITGTANGLTIFATSLYDGPDQLIFSPAARAVDRFGFSFSVGDGTNSFNIYEDDGGYATDSPYYCGAIYCLLGPGITATGGAGDPVVALTDFTLTPVSETPLPATLPLFASGLGGLGLLSWRRKRKAQAIA